MRRTFIESMMTKTIVCSLMLLGVMQTPSEAGDCYFNSTTYEPPDFARCYPQQSSPTYTEWNENREQRGQVNRRARR
jgi:hypothetical protein